MEYKVIGMGNAEEGQVSHQLWGEAGMVELRYRWCDVGTERVFESTSIETHSFTPQVGASHNEPCSLCGREAWCDGFTVFKTNPLHDQIWYIGIEEVLREGYCLYLQ